MASKPPFKERRGEDASRLRALVAPSNRPEETRTIRYAGVLFSGGRRLSDAKEPLAGVVISGIGVSSVAFLILASIF